MLTTLDKPTAAVIGRLEECYGSATCRWDRFYRPRQQKLNFATRYHLVYPALAYFIEMKRSPDARQRLRPQLDTIYRGLLEPRCWTYWHDELGEKTWPLLERNLTYAGRLATFIGFYIDAFGTPPAERIELDGHSTTYSDLSKSLADQMAASPSCGVSCYEHQSMVMCNAHMLINNILHDRLFGTEFAGLNDGWVANVFDNLVRDERTGPLFYFGTQPDSPSPIEEKRALGADIWALFLMSGVVPGLVGSWFERWAPNIVESADEAHVEVAPWEAEMEFSSNEIATAWAYCLARELGREPLATRLREYLAPRVVEGIDIEPYFSGLFLLGERLERGDFARLVSGARA